VTAVRVFVLKVSSRLVAAAVVFVAAKVIAKSEYANYAFALGMFPLLHMVSTVGSRSSLRRFLPYYGDKVKRTVLIKELILIFVGLYVVISMITIPILYFTDNLLSGQFYYLVAFHILGVAILVYQISEIMLKSETENFAFFLLGHGIYNLARIVLLISIVQNVIQFVYIDTILLVLFTVLYFRRYSRKYKIVNARITTKKLIFSNRFLKYSKFSFFNESGGAILDTGTDLLFLGYFMESVVIADYFIAMKLCQLLMLLVPVVSLHDYLNTKVFGNYDEQRSDELLYENGSRLALVAVIMSALIFMGFWLFGEYFLTLVMPNYSTIYSTILLMLFFLGMNSIQYACSTIFSTQKTLRPLLKMRLSSVLNIVLNFILIPLLGIEGAVLSTGFSALLGSLYLVNSVQNSEFKRVVFQSLFIFIMMTMLPLASSYGLVNISAYLILCNYLCLGIIMFTMRSRLINGISGFVNLLKG